MKVTIQPAELPDGTLPYPYHIEKGGYIGRQDFWKGQPNKLVGFTPQPVAGNVPGMVRFAKFWKDPQACVGMFAIFSNDDGSMRTCTQAIEKITVS